MPQAVVFGCEGTSLTSSEHAFFRESDPWGFVLFTRNLSEPDQIRRLVADMRESVGRPDAPVFIDQEGGRVQRLKPPLWRKRQPAARFGAIHESDPHNAVRLTRLQARAIAADLFELGITVNCAPCLDVAQPYTHSAIGDRAFSTDPHIVAALGQAFADGLMAGGVLPVIKHMPGHGRARVDSHLEIPVVEATPDILAETDFAPFHAARSLPMGMTAHLVFPAIDPTHPATQSARVIQGVIRGKIGFDGLLLTDDLSMKALRGSYRERSEAALYAGCDILLHCNGNRSEMEGVAAAAPKLTGKALRRCDDARAQAQSPDDWDRDEGEAILSAAFDMVA